MPTTYKLSNYVRALRRAIADDDDAGYKHLVEDFLIDDKGATPLRAIYPLNARAGFFGRRARGKNNT